MKLLLIGKSCSGKTTIAERLATKGKRVAVYSTTREIRESETDGKDYYFVDEFEYSSEEYLVDEEYNTWKYGLKVEEAVNSDIIICTPTNVSKIDKKLNDLGYKTLKVYIDTSIEIRHARYSKRQSVDSEGRRFIADEIHFNEFRDYDMRIEIKTENSVENFLSFVENLR